MARLQKVGRTGLYAMYEAAADVTGCVAALAERGRNPITEVLDGVDIVEEWAHFPPGDITDGRTQSQFYYHAHAADERACGEHGHFHVFVRPDRVDPKPQPASIGDATKTSSEAAGITHLVGISTDACGQPIRLFTTNRWVTGEVWHDAETVINMIDRFDMNNARPSQILNRWMTAVIRLYRPQIEDLLRARDAKLNRFKTAYPMSDVFEDRTLQVTSEMPVDFLVQIRTIETALERQSA